MSFYPCIIIKVIRNEEISPRTGILENRGTPKIKYTWRLLKESQSSEMKDQEIPKLNWNTDVQNNF